MAKRRKKYKVEGIDRDVVRSIVEANTKINLGENFRYGVYHLQNALCVKSKLYSLEVIDKVDGKYIEVFRAVVKKPKPDKDVSRPHAVNDTHEEHLGNEAFWLKTFGTEISPNLYYFDLEHEVMIMEAFNMSLSEYLQGVWDQSYRGKSDIEKRRIKEKVREVVRRCIYVSIDCDLEATSQYKNKDRTEKIESRLCKIPEDSLVSRLEHYLRSLGEFYLRSQDSDRHNSERCNAFINWLIASVKGCSGELEIIARYIANGNDTAIHGDAWPRNILIQLEPNSLEGRLLIESDVLKTRITDPSKVRLGPPTKGIIEPMMDFSFMTLYEFSIEEIKIFFDECVKYAQSLWDTNEWGKISNNPDFDFILGAIFNLGRGIGMAITLEHEEPGIYGRFVKKSPKLLNNLHIMDNHCFVFNRLITLHRLLKDNRNYFPELYEATKTLVEGREALKELKVVYREVY